MRVIVGNHAESLGAGIKLDLLNAEGDWVDALSAPEQYRSNWFHPIPNPSAASKVTAESKPGAQPSNTRMSGLSSRLADVPRVIKSTDQRRSHTFTDLFYGRLKLEPATIDLGSVLSAQTKEVELWNATFEPVTISSILTTDASGVSLVFPTNPPFVLPPLASIYGEVSATPQGPAEIDAKFLINAAAAEVADVQLRVLGRRNVLFTLAPSTDKPYVEKLTWRTDIITSYDGSEQRVSLSDNPDTEINMTLLTHRKSAHLVESLLWGWQSKAYGLPMWHRATPLTQSASAGNTEIFLDPSFSNFSVDGIIILWRGQDLYEAQEIEEIRSSSIVLRRPLQNGWPVGVSAMPLRAARLPADVQVQWLTPDIASYQLNFILNEPEIEPAADLGIYYRGLYVMNHMHNWTSPVQEKSSLVLDAFETETGNRFVVQRRKTPATVKNHSLFLNSKSKIRAVRRWLYGRRGAAAPFWLPSGKADLQVVARIEAGSDELTVASAGYHSVVLERNNRRDLIIYTRRGTFLRRISASATGDTPGTEIIKLQTTIDTRIEPSEVIMVSFLGLCRLENDSVELDWRSEKLVLCNLSTRLLSDDVTGR